MGGRSGDNRPGSRTGKPTNSFPCGRKKRTDAPDSLAAWPPHLHTVVDWKTKTDVLKGGQRGRSGKEKNIFTSSWETCKEKVVRTKERRKKKKKKGGSWCNVGNGHREKEVLQRLKQHAAQEQKICSHVEAESTGGLTEKGRGRGRRCFLLSILISTHTRLTLTVWLTRYLRNKALRWQTCPPVYSDVRGAREGRQPSFLWDDCAGR